MMFWIVKARGKDYYEILEAEKSPWQYNGPYDTCLGGFPTYEEASADFKCDLSCKECGHRIYANWVEERKALLIEHHLCFTCAHWLIDNPPGAGLVIDGVHFYAGGIKSGGMRGMGGQRYVIERFDGGVEFTNNLWCQGGIPERLRPRYPDNATKRAATMAEWAAQQ